MTKTKIQKLYDKIVQYHKKYLKKYGVFLPALQNKKGLYTKDALALVYLSQRYPKTKKITKWELTQFIRRYYPNTNDVQQARHLGAQKGWWILAGGRDNIVLSLERGEYQLYTLEKPYPGFKKHRRQKDLPFNWQTIKKTYGNRCITCGSKEGKPHFHWPSTKTKLQKAHKDPEKSLANNIIPQCQKCNRADRNRWVYDDKGRVVKIANAEVLKYCSEFVQRRAYEILYKKYKGISPSRQKRK